MPSTSHTTHSEPMAQEPAAQRTTPLVVTAAEAGMKLLRFLERRLEEAPPTGALHKWIRTGQVRINGKRCQPFSLLEQGDAVRLPPFAVARQLGEEAATPPDTSQSTPKAGRKSAGAETAGQHNGNHGVAQPYTVGPQLLGADLPITAVGEDYLLLAKPAGLAVQPGTKQTQSVTSRLQAAFGNQAFIPAPVHRLDKPVSGLLLVATAQQGAQRFSAAFAAGNTLCKEYVAVVAGQWPHATPQLLLHTLEKRTLAHGQERMVCVETGEIRPWNDEEEEESRAALLHHIAQNKLAALVVRPAQHPPCKWHKVALRGTGLDTATLLYIELITGKHHQIRAQLAHMGTPIVGDKKYGGPAFSHLLLHAFALRLPEGTRHTLAPQWPAPFQSVCLE
ncbi:RluA family pseudouridine synthase [Desulfovibrio cuneatus]|uniref:RluA family pseudouridine synthase n=1 Tax=Desulfovibrio cuneatus TaxID=159728 RepID=UPI00041C369C|nr:RluA family pseudouridine synthase [Desulfovibrio cuneatus]